MIQKVTKTKVIAIITKTEDLDFKNLALGSLNCRISEYLEKNNHSPKMPNPILRVLKRSCTLQTLDVE